MEHGENSVADREIAAERSRSISQIDSKAPKVLIADSACACLVRFLDPAFDAAAMKRANRTHTARATCFFALLCRPTVENVDGRCHASALKVDSDMKRCISGICFPRCPSKPHLLRTGKGPARELKLLPVEAHAEPAWGPGREEVSEVRNTCKLCEFLILAEWRTAG